MKLKRKYNDEQKVVGVEVLQAGRKQRFSEKLVKEAGNSVSWMEVQGGYITLRSEPPLVYRIVSDPGYYCCFCDKKFDGSAETREHVLNKHGNRKSPDPENPSGYKRQHYYECVLDGNEESENWLEGFLKKLGGS